MMEAVTFTPAGDATGVFVCIPEADAMVYVAAGYTTDDPAIAAALDMNPNVVRAEAPAAPASSTPKEN